MDTFRGRIIFLLTLCLGQSLYGTCPNNLKKRGIDPLDVYMAEVALYPPLTRESEIELAQRFAADPNGPDGRDARAQMIEANLPRVVGVAMNYLVPGVDVMDTIQDGNIGLMKGVAGYDYRRNVRLGTYVTYAIKVSIRKGLTDLSRVVRQPAWVVSAKNKWKLAEEYLMRVHDAIPTEEQIMKQLADSGMKAGKIILIRNAVRQGIADNGDEGKGEDHALAQFDERFIDRSVPVENAADEAEMRKIFATAVSGRWSGLDDREALTLRLRFGFEGAPQKLREVGARLGVTREWARRIEAAALGKLLQAMEDGTLPSADDYVEMPKTIPAPASPVEHRRAG